MSHTTATTSDHSFAALPPRPDRRRRVAVIVTAAVAALIVWAVVAHLLAIPLDVRSGAQVQHVGAASVAIVSLVVGLLGWLALAALERLTPRRSATMWLIVGGVVLLLKPRVPARQTAQTQSEARGPPRRPLPRRRAHRTTADPPLA